VLARRATADDNDVVPAGHDGTFCPDCTRIM